MRSRLFVAGLAVAGGLALGACGSGGTGTSSGSTILPLTPTNFATIPTVPATTTTTLPPEPGASLEGESTYVIQSGDLPATIATKFKVKLADLLTINGWTLQGQYVPDFPAAGTEIKIPPGATQPGAAATATATSTASDGGPTTTTAAGAAGATTTTAKAGSSKSTTTTSGGATTPTNSAGPCVEGTYTIQKGDIPLNVAKKFDLTVDQLDAANASTKGYKAFIVGTKIIIPKGSNCPAT